MVENFYKVALRRSQWEFFSPTPSSDFNTPKLLASSLLPLPVYLFYPTAGQSFLLI